MHVAFVSMLTDQHDETDATLRTKRTARLLAERGHDVTFLSAQWWDGDIDEFERDGVAYRAVTDAPAAGTFGAKLPAALWSVRPDVVHAVNAPSAHVAPAGVAARTLRVPLVVDWSGDVGAATQASVSYAARRPEMVLAPSRTIQTWVREHGRDERATRVVPESIDMSLVRDAPVDERADIVYARNLDEYANVENFLLALAELRDRGWRAAVVGDGPRRAEAEATARDLRIADRVDFMGDLPPEEFVPILKGAHVFAQTAHRESFATNLLWALACGCIGIVEYQANSSAHELVEGRQRASLVTSPQELADGITRASHMAHRTVDEEYGVYDHEEVLDQYLDCYRSLIDG